MESPAHAFLDHCGIPNQRATFALETAKGAASVARALGYRAAQIVKTLIFTVNGREPVLVMLPGDRSAVSRHLKRAIGSRDVRLASAEVVEAVTGYAIGSIPPFHWHPPGLRTFVDASLMRELVLGVGAGDWGHEILMAPRDLVAATAAQVVNLTDPARPPTPAGRDTPEHLA